MGIEKMMPKDTPDYLVGAWISCLRWAIAKDEIVKAFEHDTGFKYILPKNRLEQMIDEQTGMDRQFVFKFIEWFNENVWGKIEA